jgi:hypothetical protein
MDQQDLDFEVAPEEMGAARAAEVQYAIKELDRYGRQLGPGRGGQTEEGDFAREFADDVVELGTPDVLPLNLDTLTAEPQVDTKKLLETSKFYFLKLPVKLEARPGWGFNQLLFKAEFNRDEADATKRPRVHDALPAQEWVTKAKASAELSLGLRGNLKIAAGVPPVVVPGGGELQADAAAHAKGKTELVWGPFEYEMRLPRVQRSNADLHDVRWVLSGRRIINESDPGLRVVLRVPHDVEQLKLRAAVKARRTYAYDDSLVEAFKAIPPRVVAFFTGGAALGDVQAWDLSGSL